MVSIRDKFVSFLSTLFTIYITAIDGSKEEIERHLEMGKQFLAKGQFSDALTQYHAAVELDPDNYQSLYRRATCYLAMGKSKAALPDLDRVIELKRDFASARVQRANILLKFCDLNLAAADYRQILIEQPNNAEAQLKLSQIEPTKQDISLAEEFFAMGDYSSAEHHYTRAIEVCPTNAELHEKRAICFEDMGQIHKAIADIRSTAKLVPDSTEAYYKISDLYHRMGDAEQGLVQIRECLKLNPEHKKCFPLYKILKKLVKDQDGVTNSRNNNNWADCIEGANRILKSSAKIPAIVLQAKEHQCHCYSKDNKAAEAIKVCNEVLSVDPENSDVLCDRANAFIANEQLEDAIQDYQAALKKNDDNRRAKEGLDRAQKLLKQMQKKDYYKILGVKRNAKKKDIMRAYRKLAAEWHPDNFKPEEKEQAQKKFIDIAAAKEVLTDPEKRAQFDNGEDPLDPETQQHHHNPFQGFQSPFGGSFKFHFQ